MNQNNKMPTKAAAATTKKVPVLNATKSGVKNAKVAPKTPRTTTKVAVKKSPTTKPGATSKKTPASSAKPSKSVQSKVAAKVATTAPAAKPPKAEKKKRQKMVRDSFNMPESDYAYIAALKKRCLKAGTSAKKSEVLRAALKCLSDLSDLALTKAIANLEPIKTGRPSKR